MIRKIKNNKIKLEYLFGYPKLFVVTSSNNIKKIFEDWKKITSIDPLPDEIIVTQEGDTVTFEPVFYK